MPDSTEYSAMDLKKISWFGNIYEKFEALCLEVEEDTVNYIESQVQTVGESVKKFYSEVMQDLSLFSQHEIEKKARENLIEQPGGVEMKLSEDTKVPKGKNNLGGKSLGIGDYSKDDQSLLKMSGSVTPLSEKRNRMSSVYENRRGYLMARDHISVGLAEFVNSECNTALARGCASKETTMETRDHIPVVSNTVISSSIDAAASDTTSPVESSGLLVEDFALISSFDDPSLRSSAWTHINDDRDQTSSGTITNTIGKESAERSQNCNTDIVETFDVIEGNELRFPEQPVKHKSYKKRIREAFCSKKGSTREYEHLIAQHKSQPLNRKAEENVIAKSNMKLSASDFPDSEWELI